MGFQNAPPTGPPPGPTAEGGPSPVPLAGIPLAGPPPATPRNASVDRSTPLLDGDLLVQGDDHRFLLEQRLASRVHKNISYDPANGRAAGFAHESREQAERLRHLLASFSRTAVAS